MDLYKALQSRLKAFKGRVGGIPIYTRAFVEESQIYCRFITRLLVDKTTVMSANASKSTAQGGSRTSRQECGETHQEKMDCSVPGTTSTSLSRI